MVWGGAEQMFLILLGMLWFKWEYPGFIDKPSTFNDMRGTLNPDHQAVLLLRRKHSLVDKITGASCMQKPGGL